MADSRMADYPMADYPDFNNISFDPSREPVALIRLDRPEQLNALNSELMHELVGLLDRLDGDDDFKTAVITGNQKAFAAGADVDEMKDMSSVDILKRDHTKIWEGVRTFRKPLIGAVSGVALGGGNELALQCDILIADESAKFGQPEINIGVMPGAGGTQRLTRVLGKYRAMEMILTGEPIGAEKARDWGLVNRVVDEGEALDEALDLAGKIAERPQVALMLAKDSVRTALETGLSEGLEYERKLFYFLFSTEDQEEGMEAFKEKRDPEWQGE